MIGTVVFAKVKSNDKDDKGKDYIVWTQYKLSQEEKQKVFNAITSKVAKEFAGEFEANKFFYGFNAENKFYNNGMTITENGISFDDTSLWRYLATGTYTKEAINVTGASITNTTETTTVSVKKTWDDNNDQDGKRPSSVTVKLLANNNETGDTLTLSETKGWTDTFTDLPKYKNGSEIAYTVEEVLDGDTKEYYDSEVKPVNCGFEITNSHTPATTTVSGSKTWDDASNQDNKRPESITINLLKDGSKIASKTVTEQDGWSWSFENLPKYEKGVEIKYTITEEQVSNYSADIKGYNITNQYTPGKVSVTVIKSWDDADNKDGSSPKSVTVKLLADGQLTDQTISLNEENQWTNTFKNLPEYKSGKKIVYTIEEVSVDGYTVAISGDAKEGFTITNTYISTSAPESNPGSKPESNPIRDTVTIEIGNNGKPEEANPDTGAPLMFAPVMAAALAAAVVVKRKK